MQFLAKMVLRLFQIMEEENQRKKTNEITKKGKKTKKASPQIHALENVKEGIEGIDSEKTSLMPQIKFRESLVNLPPLLHLHFLKKVVFLRTFWKVKRKKHTNLEIETTFMLTSHKRKEIRKCQSGKVG
nr:cellulose synthase A catalytic subunit 2 [UDP-forming]-like [Tanacetum cinerariifolium]